MSFSMSLNCTPFTRPVWKKVWGSACPSSRREASASPATTYSTCCASCRLHARSRTSSSTSGRTTTRSSLSGRQPIFTRNRATPRIAFGESPRGCLLKRVTLLYYQVILVSVMVFILVAGRSPSREDLIILSFRPKQIWNISDIALYCTNRSTLINTFALPSHTSSKYLNSYKMWPSVTRPCKSFYVELVSDFFPQVYQCTGCWLVYPIYSENGGARTRRTEINTHITQKQDKQP